MKASGLLLTGLSCRDLHCPEIVEDSCYKAYPSILLLGNIDGKSPIGSF